MKNIVFNKLKSTSGESIAETLVAVLISAFALLMLAGTVNTASNLITGSQNNLEEYYESNNTLADLKSVTPETYTASIYKGTPEDPTSTLLETGDVSAYIIGKDSIIGNKDLVSYVEKRGT